MPTYFVPAIVPYVTEVCGFVEVEARSPQEAQEKALKAGSGSFYYDPHYQDPGDAADPVFDAAHAFGATLDRAEAARIAANNLGHAQFPDPLSWAQFIKPSLRIHSTPEAPCKSE